MAFFNDLTTSLKQKWLQFFQVNRSWITRHMEVQYVDTPDGGRRPPSYLILGVANALEPQLADLMLPFSKLNPDVEALIDALELNFDPDLVLGNRFHAAANLEAPRYESSEVFDEEVAPMLQEPIYNVTVVETLTEVEPAQMIGVSLDNTDSEVVLVETDDESVVVLNVDELDELSNLLLDDTAEEVVLVESDDGFGEMPSAVQPGMFGDMSLDEIADVTAPLESDDRSSQTPNASQPHESEDVLSDIWGEQTLADSEQADEKQEKQSEHDQEISRLFPNL